MSTHNYKKLEVYSRSLNLAARVIRELDSLPQKRLSAQLISSSVSVPSNIAEGASRSGRREFQRFLEYSGGSAAELQTQLRIVQLANLADATTIKEMLAESEIICKMISRLYSALDS